MAKPSATTSKPVTTGATTPQPSADGTDAHWADQIADLIVDGVDRVRDRTVTPAQALAKYVVYGVIVAVLALPLLVVTLVLLVRVLDAFIPSGVWAPYLILGAVFVIAGALLWSKRSK
mgnify:FL=1